jgi:hypothetical protein
MGTGERGNILRVLSTVAKCRWAVCFTIQQLFTWKIVPFARRMKIWLNSQTVVVAWEEKYSLACIRNRTTIPRSSSPSSGDYVGWNVEAPIYATNSDAASYISTTDCTPRLLCLLTLRFTTARNVWLFFNLVLTLVIDRSQSSLSAVEWYRADILRPTSELIHRISAALRQMEWSLIHQTSTQFSNVAYISVIADKRRKRQFSKMLLLRKVQFVWDLYLHQANKIISFLKSRLEESISQQSESNIYRPRYIEIFASSRAALLI